MLRINHQNKVPLHVQVEENFRKLIETKKYKDGALLPREVELANKWGMSRNTIRQATNKLKNEGLIVRKRGVGTMVVKKEGLHTHLDHWYSFTKEMQERGVQTFNLSLKVSWVDANEKIKTFFNLKSDKKILRLDKVKADESGEPIVYFESYFHPRLGLNENDDFNKPLYKMLEEKFGVFVNRSYENINAKLANNMAKKLHIDPASPVLFRERFVYDIGDRAVEYNIGYYRSDKFTYSINIKNNQQ